MGHGRGEAKEREEEEEMMKMEQEEKTYTLKDVKELLRRGELKVGPYGRHFPIYFEAKTEEDLRRFEEWLKRISGKYLTISVWNCRATLIIEEAHEDGSVEAYIVEDSDEIEDELIRAVEEQGGAINISGFYSPTARLLEVIKSWGGQ